MPITVQMPALSPTMVDGTLAKWHVGEGDSVAAGDILAEIETDKAIMEFEAVDDGTVMKLLVDEGATNVPVNIPIAIILQDGESPPDRLETDTPAIPGAAPWAASPVSTGTPASTPPGTPATQVRTAPAPARPGQARLPERSGGERLFSSPLARRLARENGLDLAAIPGSGPGGRIIKRDIEAAIADPVARRVEPATAVASEWEKVAAIYPDRRFEEVPLDNMRKTIAARLVEAKQTVPHFYLRRDIMLDAVIETRAMLNRELESRGIRISINDFVIKASALALQLVPDANAVWAHDRLLKFHSSDVAVAVAVDGGLFTPVLRDAQEKPMVALSQEMKSLAARAKDRRLKPEEYIGGSFAISNLGMFGIESFDAVINPPHGSILAVGSGRRVAVEGDRGQTEFRTAMSVTLSCDHRVIDGALGASFLAEIARHLESPTLLML